jgi:precorrin-6B methylase 2
LIGELLLPPYSLGVMTLVGLLFLRTRPRLGRGLIAASVALLVVLSFPVVSYCAAGGAQQSASDVRAYVPGPYPQADAIVILGGGRRRFAVEYDAPETADYGTLIRLRYGARLYKQYGYPVVVTGGRPHMGVERGVLAEADITKTKSFLSGLVEVQDLGSQLILASAAITPGGRWFDACAGAGGKTLQLASLLGPTGHIDAYDIRPSALRELQIRAQRARISNIAILPTAPTAQYDGVLVDAPCSGTGTWRRAPHLKWTTTPAQVTAAAAQQLALLTQYAALVRPGGQLIYATCSLSRFENEEVITDFLAANPTFKPEPPTPARAFGFIPDSTTGGLTILPAKHNTDGFFVATLRRS